MTTTPCAVELRELRTQLVGFLGRRLRCHTVDPGIVERALLLIERRLERLHSRRVCLHRPSRVVRVYAVEFC